jgi:hypothetical protein
MAGKSAHASDSAVTTQEAATTYPTGPVFMVPFQTASNASPHSAQAARKIGKQRAREG